MQIYDHWGLQATEELEVEQTLIEKHKWLINSSQK